MKIRNILPFAACIAFIGSPFTKTLAADSTAVPSAAPSAKPKPSVDPVKAQWNAAHMKALQDPDVKATMDAARAAMLDANKKVLEKMREIDPTLGLAVDKEEARMKPPEPKAKPDPKPVVKKPAAASPADASTPAAQ